MSKENEYNLRPLWDEILKIYDAIKLICEQNGLRYFVAGGTLIGALRHKGFVPWDDDFDVFMPRPDYDRLVDLAVKMLPKGMEWHSVETDSEYCLRFGKVYMTNGDAIKKCEAMSGLKLTDGVYVDVFPIDGLPSTSVGRFFWCVKRSLFKRSNDRNRLLYALLLGTGANQHANRLLFQKWMKKIPFENAKRVGTPSPYENTATPQRWWFPREWFASFREVPFEDRVVRIPSGAHELLTSVFGDYMKLPPVEQRRPSHQKG